MARDLLPAKPSIGLALGGGVARGWAHIGVIRAMLANGYVPDIVCGTSIGAVVGGCYLAGRLDTLEDWARSLNRRRMLGYLDIRIGSGGVLGGRRLQKMLERYMGSMDIWDLNRPFAAIASELATGHEYWIERGNLVRALQASYALPGVFPPQKIEGRWLVDGALVNPVPVSVCRAKGARLVIAVTLNADAFGKSTVGASETAALNAQPTDDASFEKLGAKLDPANLIMKQLFGTAAGAPGLGTVMLGSLNIVTDRLARSRMAGDPPDILISPRIGHISLFDFDRAAELIDLGYAAFEAQLPMIEEAMGILT